MRRARLLAEAAAGFPGRPDDFGSALAENRDQAGRFPAWPVTLIRDLGRAGQAAEAVMLSEALAVVDPPGTVRSPVRRRSRWPKPGWPTMPTKIAENMERWPDDVRARLLAGDALAMLGNTEAALAQFQVALLLAQRAKDFKVTGTCPRGSSGSPIPPPTRWCSAASPAPGRPSQRKGRR